MDSPKLRMHLTIPNSAAFTLLVLAAVAACGSATRSPVADVSRGPVSEAARATTATVAGDTLRRGYATADVRFAQHMIAHHGQALEMVALVPARANRSDLRTLAARIEVSQRDEIASMQRWLKSRGEEAPDTEAHHGHVEAGAPEAAMPGMLSPVEMATLAAANGPEFDRLFLELMIRHHEGALAMVAELFASPGGGQEPEIFGIASEVDADQRAEIERMRSMLRVSPGG